jgi:probable addiction module antidote protein
MKRKPTVSYEEGLHERLMDPEYAAEYLNAHLDANDTDNLEAFMLALRDVATAYGIATISEKASLGRESLYKSLSKSGNPKIDTLAALLNAMGLKLAVEARPAQRKRASGQ